MRAVAFLALLLGAFIGIVLLPGWSPACFQTLPTDQFPGLATGTPSTCPASGCPSAATTLSSVTSSPGSPTATGATTAPAPTTTAATPACVCITPVPFTDLGQDGAATSSLTPAGVTGQQTCGMMVTVVCRGSSTGPSLFSLSLNDAGGMEVWDSPSMPNNLATTVMVLATCDPTTKQWTVTAPSATAHTSPAIFTQIKC